MHSDFTDNTHRSATLVRETEAFAVKLFLENSVLLDEVLDDMGLVAVDPTCEGGEKALEGIEIGQWIGVVVVRAIVVSRVAEVRSSFGTPLGSRVFQD